MENKNISQKQFKRISAFIITMLGVLVIALTLAVAILYNQSKENEKELASIKYEMKPHVNKDGSYHNTIFTEQPLPTFSGKTKAQKLVSAKDNSVVGMATRLDKLELRLAKYDNKFGVNTMNPYTDIDEKMKKDKDKEVEKYLVQYYHKYDRPMQTWEEKKEDGRTYNKGYREVYEKIGKKMYPTVPENAR